MLLLVQGFFRTFQVPFSGRQGLRTVFSNPNCATASPTWLAFTPQTVGTTNAAKSVTLTSNLAIAMPISSFSFSGANPGDFAHTNTCDTSLAAKAHCTISVTFKPIATDPNFHPKQIIHNDLTRKEGVNVIAYLRSLLDKFGLSIMGSRPVGLIGITFPRTGLARAEGVGHYLGRAAVADS